NPNSTLGPLSEKERAPHTFRARINARGELGYAAPRLARHQLCAAAAFLAGLAEQGRALADTTQGDLDRLFAEGTPRLRDILQPFLRWR
ncbi:MAG: hypothetical protein ACTMIR_06715, partial [Cellulomonadaceae bacterium]